MTFIGRLAIRTKVVLLAGIPVLGILILAAVIAERARTQTAAAAALGSIEDVAQLSVRISGVLHALQLERARAALNEGCAQAPSSVARPIHDARPSEATDAAQKQLDRFLAGHDLSLLPARLARDLGVARTQAMRCHEFRTRMLREDVAIDDILNFYGTADDALVSATAALTDLSDDGELLRSISSLVALSQLTERTSREHALLSYVFAAQEFPPGAFKTLVTLATEQAVYADTFRANARGSERRQYDSAQKSDTVVRARAIRDDVLRTTSDDFDVDARTWFDAAAAEVSKLQSIEQALLSQITRVATHKLETTRASVRLGLWLSIGVVFASGLLAWFIAHGVTRSIVDLSSAAAQVRQTNDFTVRAQKTSTDELGTLADTFNEMLTMIEARDTHLEAQVAERTDALRRTVAELWSEMDLARKIQTLLLPQDPQLPSYEIAAQMVPASSVGGDYYDVFRSDGVDWILVGDVSGHGVTAGLTMMIIQTAVRTVIESAGERAHLLTPKQLLSRVNRAVRSNLQKIDTDQYMTIMALRLEHGKISYSGLHQDILVYRALSKTVERIETRGLWIGLVDDISDLLEEDKFEMADGDVLLLYTDGVTEIAAGDHLLGTDGLASLLQRLADGNSVPADIVKGVVDRACVTTLDDDVTVLAARYMPSKDTGTPRLPCNHQVSRPPTEWPGKGARVVTESPAQLEALLALINVSLPHTWDHIRKIRKSVGEALKDREPALRAAAMMVASELVENAVKYGQSVPAAAQVCVSMSLDSEELRITVSNGSTDSAGVGELQRRVEQIIHAPDKAALYMARLEELLVEPRESGKLGLYRIAFEGQFDLRFSYLDDVVTVVATRSVHE